MLPTSVTCQAVCATGSAHGAGKPFPPGKAPLNVLVWCMLTLCGCALAAYAAALAPPHVLTISPLQRVVCIAHPARFRAVRHQAHINVQRTAIAGRKCQATSQPEIAHLRGQAEQQQQEQGAAKCELSWHIRCLRLGGTACPGEPATLVQWAISSSLWPNVLSQPGHRWLRGRRYAACTNWTRGWP